ncbi:unnamed protein product [Brugia pahangi]|uniref:Protein-L-isoaspartate O-methyltransferase domain-containing protein 1 n=1 Tax=Brugia pahangi TaxID=6280 RepID=A0A0N4TTX0_BRUPA|nr:unnamed protein product [Brugia pahangi]
MGLAASSGHDNDDLIDKLIDANIVVTHRVEIALRLVDRRRFFPVEGRYIAYKDLAWKSDFGSPGRIHISAPCIYGNVLECLDLQEGNSFLNVGSGTGYLSTVAGYLLGSNGTNHGVEIHPNIVEYARSLVVETLNCPETQCYDWAIPQFSCGNGLHLSPSHYSKYDRVYCGAAVPPSYRRILWELLKVDGILVMPYEDQLLQVRRQSANVFDVKIITSVSFSDFIPPTEEETSKELYSNAPSFRMVPTLQFLCALSIRKIIRAAVASNHKIHIRNFVGQQPHRIRENHVVVQFRDGEQPVAQQFHFENRHPPLREILAIVGADFIADDENDVNDDVGEAEPGRRRRLVRDRFRMVWFRHHLRAHIANRVVRRRRPLDAEAEAEAQEEDAGIEDDQNSDVEITDENENSEYSGSGSLSATTSDPTDTSVDTTESCNDNTSATGRSKKRSLEEYDGESSLSVKRRNDDDKGFTDKGTMEIGLVNDYKTQNIPNENVPDKNGSNDESAITPIAQETLTQPEGNANQKSEKNLPEQSEHFEEAENSNNLKFVERTVENSEGSVNHWAEVVEQLRDLREREAEDNRIIVMGSISKHNGNSFHSSLRDQSIDSCEVQNGITRSNDFGNSNHDEKYEQESSKSANLSVQIQNSKMHNEANDEKLVNNLTNTNIHSTEPDEMENTLRADHEFLPSSKDFDTKDDELMWQNNKLYKNKSETSSAERYNSNNCKNLVSNSSDKSEILSTSNNELEQDKSHLITNVEGGNSDNDGDNDDYGDDGDDVDDDDDDNDDDSDDNSDDTDDEEDGSADSNSSDPEDQEDNPEYNNGNHFYPVNSRDENDLYLAVHETARNITAAINDQAFNHNRGNGGEAMNNNSSSRRRSNARDELQADEKKREQARLEERGRQLSDIRKFAALFESRVMDLPLNSALKKYIKCLC